MQTGQVAQSIDGTKLYHERARKALPLLIRQALSHSPIFYSDLASELHMPNPRNLNYVLGTVGRALVKLSKEWKEKVPPLQCLVLNKNTGLPGNGIGWFITNKEHFRKLALKQKRALVNRELREIFAYPKWNDVLAAFGMKPSKQNYATLLKQASLARGGGESEEHRRLKLFVANNPGALQLPPDLARGETEYPLPSGDSLDVLFRHNRDWIAVEVKSSLSSVADILRGLFQCVKYRAVVEAYQATENLPQSARTILVLEGTLPAELLAAKNMLGIEVKEGVKPH